MDEINLLEGLNVRSELQEVLEKQAEAELKHFKNKDTTATEEGEISDDEVEPCAEQTFTGKAVSLDINSYIQRQEELKKHQQHTRSLRISDQSRQIAQSVSLKQRKCFKKAKVEETKIITEKEVNKNDGHLNNESDSDYVPSDGELDEVASVEGTAMKRKRSQMNRNPTVQKIVDDGSLACYKERLAQYYKRLENEQKLLGLDSSKSDDLIEPFNNFRVCKKMWSNLYSYQQDGIEWLYELHKRKLGGILGDEMGLGKTVQIIAFLSGINNRKHCNGVFRGLGPTVIVCPATVVHQWVQHFHEWSPEFRVGILHQSGSYTGNKLTLIRELNKEHGILITTYSGVLKYEGALTQLNWHYIILDEGHKIRNPNAKVSKAVKEIGTHHRLMLTGSPMQNNLQELWSLFDFTNPGMLGTLDVFMEHFANPIIQGDYTNATHMQKSLALSMATAIKEIITPHLLRRTKDEVGSAIQLPSKSEQVLFCSLTDEQRDLYKGYIMGDHISSILGRGSKNWFSQNSVRANVLVGITTLRKICNHPDLYIEGGDDEYDDDIQTGNIHYKRSGKMLVISALLKIWKKQKHRVLLFTQSRGMITIFERFLAEQGYNFLKMDGSTSIKSRQPLIEKFNTDESYEIFLLTTRVGGLGINLTGADRVIIYDPDWNPATDTQARERAWRIGQNRSVTIYRLISAGTIEEKIYQRQVWKQLLSNKILLDPQTQRFFKSSDLHDLFSLQEQDTADNTETANIFKNSRVTMEKRLEEKKRKKKSKNDKIEFSDDKIQKMKELAAKIAKNLSKPEPPPKTLAQIHLEKEQKQRRLEKTELQKMSAPQLFKYNKKKAEVAPESTCNKIDELETVATFEEALEVSVKAADLYHDVKAHPIKVDKVADEYLTLISSVAATKPTPYMINKCEIISATEACDDVDESKIAGVVKMEKRKFKQKRVKSDVWSKVEKQDDYVLGKLMSKTGVHSALQHDKIVDGGAGSSSDHNTYRVHTETQSRTDKALLALRKSRISHWRW